MSRRAAFHKLTVARVDRLCDDAVAVTFDVPPDLSEDFTFAAGQYLTLRQGDERRSYSICAPAGASPRIGVRRVDGGQFSTWLVDRLNAGDVVEVLPPLGKFTPTGTGTHHGLVVAGSGTLRLDLKSSGTAITDIATNALAGGFTSGQTYQVDATAPYVSSITRLSPLAQTTKASTVTFRVVFSEKVSAVGPSDFSLTALSGTVKGSIASGDVDPLGRDGTTYDVKVSSVSGTGLLRLDLKASGTGTESALPMYWLPPRNSSMPASVTMKAGTPM